MADLVWSDPSPISMDPSLPDKSDFSLSPRGAGYYFSGNVTQKFLSINGLGHIARAHQLCMEGYQVMHDDMLSTVWSAPNYCYRCGNLASVLEIGQVCERYFNVFGPCPDNMRDVPGRETTTSPVRVQGIGNMEEEENNSNNNGFLMNRIASDGRTIGGRKKRNKKEGEITSTSNITDIGSISNGTSTSNNNSLIRAIEKKVTKTMILLKFSMKKSPFPPQKTYLYPYFLNESISADMFYFSSYLL